MGNDIAGRLDRLPWSRWHVLVVATLGVTWLLDGLEGSLGGSLAGVLKDRDTLGLTDAQLGLSSTVYLCGAVLGALVFGYLADRYGRRKLFTWTLLLYLCATAATGLSWNLLSFTCFRVLTGAGIGGEYAAINSAIDELIPARLRGRIDLWVNGTFWLGIMLGSLVATTLISPHALGRQMGWRVAFASGIPLGAMVLVLRRHLPESPRWLLSKGRIGEAETTLARIESRIAGEADGEVAALRTAQGGLRQRSPLRELLRMMAGPYRGRALLCFALMAAQAFFYNSVFFSLSLVLLRYYGVPADRAGLLFIPIAATNFLGPIALGWLFDSIGRRQMIAATFVLSGVTLLGSSWLFLQDRLTVQAQVAWWAAAFFFGSCAASSAYLTVSELFPQSVRATGIAFFYAFGTLAGGALGPLLFGHLLGHDSRLPLFAGYVLGAAVMIAAGIAQGIWGVAAEGRSLEQLAPEV